VWQRGTSFTATGYSADRWDASLPANHTVTRQLTNDTTNLPSIQYCARVGRNSGSTTTGYPQITNSFETINSIPFVGKTVTLSYYARRGADFSAAGNQLYVILQSGTGTDQSARTGYTGNVTVGQSAPALTTTWTRYSVTGTVGTSVTELGVQVFALTAGTAGANDWYEITGVQVDVGSVALPFRTYAGTVQGELAACERYFQIIASGADKIVCNAVAYNSSLLFGAYNYRTTMRTNPTIFQTSGTNYYLWVGNNNNGQFNAITALSTPGDRSVRLDVSSGVTIVQGYAYAIQTNNASTLIALQAEL
jgi:hypothetical protein